MERVAPWIWQGRSGEKHPGSKSEEFLSEFVKDMKTFQKGIWGGDLGGGAQAAKVKTFFKSLVRKLRHFRRGSGREIWGEAPRQQK